MVLQEIFVCAGHKPLPPSNWCGIEEVRLTMHVVQALEPSKDEPVVASDYQLHNTKNDSEDTEKVDKTVPSSSGGGPNKLSRRVL